MRDLPRATNFLKIEPKNLQPDGVKKKPPLSQSAVVCKSEKMCMRESMTSDISSSRPNSTASEGDRSTDDDDDEDDDEDEQQEEDDDDQEEEDEDEEEESGDKSTTSVSAGDDNDGEEEDDGDESSLDEEGPSRKQLDPISEEATIVKRSSDEENGYLF